MINESELRSMLKHWIREYGQGGMPHERSANLIATLIDHKGFVPTQGGFRGVPLNTIADEVQRAVDEMSSMPGEVGDENVLFKAAMALKAYYLTPKHWPEEERIRCLRDIGLPMSRHTFYRNIQFGRAFLLGYLTSREDEKTVA